MKTLAFVAVAAFTSVSFAAVTTPYSTDFTGPNGSTPADWTVGIAYGVGDSDLATSFNIQNNALSFVASQSTSGAVGNLSAFARVQVDAADPVANGGNFIITSEVTPASLTIDTNGNKAFQAGLVALGSSGFGGTDALHGTSDHPFYWASLVLAHDGTPSITTGDIILQRADGTETKRVVANVLDTIDIEIGSPLTFRLEGTYNELGHLTLSFTISDGTATTTPVTLIDTDPLGGDYFGYRIRQVNGDDYSIGVNLDNFSIVPEPASLSLLGLGGLAMLRRRRA